MVLKFRHAQLTGMGAYIYNLGAWLWDSQLVVDRFEVMPPRNLPSRYGGIFMKLFYLFAVVS
jgi:hypothetical protein